MYGTISIGCHECALKSEMFVPKDIKMLPPADGRVQQCEYRQWHDVSQHNPLIYHPQDHHIQVMHVLSTQKQHNCFFIGHDFSV